MSCRVWDCDHMRHAGRVIIHPSGWQIIPDSPGTRYGATGTGDLATASEYVTRAMSGELRNLETWRPGTPDQYAVADVYAPDWSHS